MSRVAGIVFQLALCCLVSFSWSSVAFAQRVVLVGPATPSAAKLELFERLRGELSSVGFAVTVFDPPAESESSDAAQRWQLMLAAERETDAAVTLVGEVTPLAVDVWLVDSAQRFQLVARVTVDDHTDNASKRLAIRASEVLRARLLETRMGKGSDLRRRPADLPSPASPEAHSKNRPVQRSFGLELGAGVLTSLDRVGPAIVPTVAFDWAIGREVVLQATFAGLGTRPRVETAAGNALVSTQSGLFGASYRFRAGQIVRPLGAVSLGMLRTGVTGQTERPREGHSLEQWSFLLDASLGAAFELSRRYTLVLAGHAQVSEPYVAIRFDDQKVASLGRPNLLLALTFGVWP